MNRIVINLDEQSAFAEFQSGVKYSWQKYLSAYPHKVNSPKNNKRYVYAEHHGTDEKDVREYDDLIEASYDSTLPATAKYLLQGIIGVTL